MTGAGRRWDSIKGMEGGCPHGSLLTLLHRVDLMHPQSKALLERAGFNVDSSRAGPDRLSDDVATRAKQISRLHSGLPS